jgi:flagellar motor switch protein FliN/FliY
MSNNPIDLFVEAFSTAAGQALSAKTSATWHVSVDQQAKPFLADTPLLTLLLVAEPSQAEAAIQVNLENAHSLAALLGGTAIATGELQPGHAQTVRAVFGEACEKAAAVLQGIQAHLRVAKTLSWTPARQLSLAATNGASGNIQLQMLFTLDWPKGVTATDATQAQASQAKKGSNVSLLENVEIDVILRFGERRLPLREIGELRSGSVIELDKSLQDPAELLLGDRVVARGEVVIVDGNYGMRITEVV